MWASCQPFGPIHWTGFVRLRSLLPGMAHLYQLPTTSSSTSTIRTIRVWFLTSRLLFTTIQLHQQKLDLWKMWLTTKSFICSYSMKMKNTSKSLSARKFFRYFIVDLCPYRSIIHRYGHYAVFLMPFCGSGLDASKYPLPVNTTRQSDKWTATVTVPIAYLPPKVWILLGKHSF